MKFRHGAVLTKGGKVVGIGHNHNRTCFKGLSVTSIHAEIEALNGKSLNTTSGTFRDFTAGVPAWVGCSDFSLS
jgi:tRNA(Arg) A34 adenosine deaminase TadA